MFVLFTWVVEVNRQLSIRRQRFFIGLIRLSIERSSFNKEGEGVWAKSSVKQDLKFQWLQAPTPGSLLSSLSRWKLMFFLLKLASVYIMKLCVFDYVIVCAVLI